MPENGCSAEHAHTFTCGLALAQLDAVLKADSTAQRFLTEEAIRALGERGVDALEHR